ncbi:hypothetical protein Kassivere_00124 [Pseudomonas phage vB_PpuM-Kassivere]
MNSDMAFGAFFGAAGLFAVVLLLSAVIDTNERIDFKEDCTLNGGIVLELENKQVCLPPQVLEMQR